MSELRPLSWAAARDLGLSWRHLGGYEWESHLRGVHTPTALDPAHPLTRIHEVADLLPSGAALTGWAAAYVLGATDLDGRHGLTGRLLPVQVWVGRSGIIRPRRTSVSLDRGAFDEGDGIVTVDGLPVTDPYRTCWSMLSRWPLEDGVVAADAMARAGLDLGELAERVAVRRRRHGLAVASAAVALADAAARSCPESRLRVVWVREAGLPYPLVNVALHGTKGQLLGLPDLFDVESALVGEYDGAGHRIDTQHQADNIREERFESHNLTVVRATKGDLLGSRRPLVERLRDGRRRGLERVRARDKWRVHLG